MVKEKVIYTTGDGKSYATKKSAERHENELVFKDMGLTVKQITEFVTDISKTNRVVESLMKTKPDWRDWSHHMVKQLPDYIEKIKNDSVEYQIITKSIWNKDPKVEQRVELPRLTDGEIPEEFVNYVDKKTKEDKTGSTYTLEVYKESERLVQYLVIETPLTPEQKLAQGKELTERDLQELVFEREELYVEEGEDRRWSRSMTTVIQAEDGNKYAIEWEKGLTENQENEFYEQPKKVTLTQRPVTTIVTKIEYL